MDGWINKMDGRSGLRVCLDRVIGYVMRTVRGGGCDNNERVCLDRVIGYVMRTVIKWAERE